MVAWHIYLREWLIFMVNVAKYTSPMDPMGFGEGLRGVPFSSWWFQRFNPFETYATVKFWIISLQAVGEHKKKIFETTI